MNYGASFVTALAPRRRRTRRRRVCFYARRNPTGTTKILVGIAAVAAIGGLGWYLFKPAAATPGATTGAKDHPSSGGVGSIAAKVGDTVTVTLPAGAYQAPLVGGTSVALKSQQGSVYTFNCVAAGLTVIEISPTSLGAPAAVLTVTVS